MPHPVVDQPTFTGVLEGTVWCFLTVNKFRVKLHDGQLVDAAVPDDLIEQMRTYYDGEPVAERIGVTLELRQRPAMHRIVKIRPENWCGEPRAGRR